MKITYKVFDTLPSTNKWAKENFSTFNKKMMTLVVARDQTAGKGQHGRSWISKPEKSICASFCFYIDENQQDPLSLTHVLAISVTQTLEASGITCQIKWPNDIMINRKKLAGILCETIHLPPFFGVIIGMGFNVNETEETLSMVGQPATSLLIEKGEIWDIDQLLNAISNQFSENLTQFLKEGFQPFSSTFRKLILPGLRNQHII